VGSWADRRPYGVIGRESNSAITTLLILALRSSDVGDRACGVDPGRPRLHVDVAGADVTHSKHSGHAGFASRVAKYD